MREPTDHQTVLPQNALVACQGAAGAYSQIAANLFFEQPDILYMRTFESVFQAVDNGLCRYGVLPMENSIAGPVTAVHDLMKRYCFSIVGNIKVSVSHRLLANPSAAFPKIKEIFTHEQAAAQCSRFLEENKHIKLTLCANTAAAARLVAESKRTDLAAIGSENCAPLYGLTVLSKDIQNFKDNDTLFICISK